MATANAIRTIRRADCVLSFDPSFLRRWRPRREGVILVSSILNVAHMPNIDDRV